MSKGSERFVVDERVGIVAVRDIWHPDYDRSGCLSSAPDIVASWSGVWREESGSWSIPLKAWESAKDLCQALNNGTLGLDHPVEADKPKSVMSLAEELEYLIRVIVRDELENRANS